MSATLSCVVGPARRFTSTLAAVLFFTSIAYASLPAKFGEWQGGSLRTIPEAELKDVEAGRAAILREYGLVAADRREYTRNGEKLAVTLWKMKDATGSLGLFTYLNRPGLAAEKLSDNSQDVIAFDNNSLLLWRGAYILDAEGADISRDDLPALAAEIPPTDEQNAILPALPSFFPVENLIPLTRKYVVGPLALQQVLREFPAAKLGLEPGTEAAVAKYQLGDTTATMLLLLYPTPQLAAKKFSEFLDLPELGGGSGQNPVFIQRKGSLVGFIIGAQTPLEATRLLDRVDYQTSLMWNEFTEPGGRNVGHLVLAVFALAGTVIAFALVAGVAFGGFRIFAKKYIPIPLFDRPSNTEIVKLHLDQK